MSPSSRTMIGVETGRIADLLTLFRIVCAVLVVAVIAADAMSVTSALLSAAWMSDFLDGRIARAGTGSRLGRWDVIADGMVGAGVALGLGLSGVLPMWVVVAAVVVFGGLFIAGNLAAGMLLQLTGFVPLLWRLWTERPTLWWLPFVTAILIGIFDWRKLIHESIPNFLRGMAGRFER